MRTWRAACRLGDCMPSLWLQVFLGTDVVTGDPVALKRIFLRRPQDGIPANVLREYMCLRHLAHDNVMRLLDVYPAVRRCFDAPEGPS